MDLFVENGQYSSELRMFLAAVAGDIDKEEGPETVFGAFAPALKIVQSDFQKSSIMTNNSNLFNLIHTYATIPQLAVVSSAFIESKLGLLYCLS